MADVTAVTWQQYFDESRFVTTESGDRFRVLRTRATTGRSVFVCHHGAGHSALSWALMARALAGENAVLAFDARGHGETQCASESLSLEQLSDDMVSVIRAMFPGKLPEELVLVGHSLGGAVVVDVVQRMLLSLGSVLGVVVLDVVEGTAIDSLASMSHYLASRPSSFASLEEAIRWSLDTGVIRDRASARVSVPGQLVQRGDKQRYFWRTNLWATEPHWQAWFTNLSSKFLSCRCAKLLILAGTDRLDKDLTIGQMQGKFQMVVLPACGHAVQEDNAEQTAATLLEFVHRNKRLVLPPKVGENGYGLSKDETR